MANVGRFFCVALPFILTLMSLILLLVAGLSGITNKSLYMFQADVSELSISTDAIKSLLNGRDLEARNIVDEVTDFIGGNDSSSSGTNITAGDLGLADHYNVGLWGFCTTDADGSNRKCTKAKYNWAASTLNTTILDKFNDVAGDVIEIPDEVSHAINAFVTVSRWTQIVFIAAFAALAVQLLVGLFATCTRIASCITFLVAGISTVIVIAAASLSTATSVIIVGAIKSTAMIYGADAHFNGTYLGLVWASAAFAIGAGFFWLFTICCCAPDHTKRRSKRSGDSEKAMATGAYQPLQDPRDYNRNSYYNQQTYATPAYPNTAQRSDMAYEPYSHR
ncbi:hypothetical protein jhhlp_005154 [Lomentospora prolificans]|uniref:SUR7 protein n=1 Tax=Lomentospora prolificans TaxID=41688 RepID=A0A2N3N756_9PEZI|nr:hypothetical protein jhhlp_005154 [Lomentospora prolificans]